VARRHDRPGANPDPGGNSEKLVILIRAPADGSSGVERSSKHVHGVIPHTLSGIDKTAVIDRLVAHGEVRRPAGCV
jgi:hypothetical protein